MNVTMWGETENSALPDDTCEHEPEPTTRLLLKETMPDGFTRSILMRGAYQCSQPKGDPHSHGVGGMLMWFILRGPKGATQWQINTGWYPRSVRRIAFDDRAMPEAWDLGYHSLTPTYEGQRSQGPCMHLDDAPCYYDGTSLNAHRFMPDFLTHPGAVWDGLRESYNAHFGL